MGFIILILWFFSFEKTCISLLFPFIVGIILFKTSFEYRLAKKLCLANCYFKEDSWLYKFLTRKVFIFITSIFGGLFLSSILMFNIINFNIIDFLILGMDIFVIVFLYKYFIKNNSFKNTIKELIIKNFVSIINSILIASTLLIISFYQTPPKYIDNDLSVTIKVASNLQRSNCEVLDTLIGITNEVVAVKWWSMLNFTLNNKNYYLKWLLWIIYFFGNYLMIFAYSRYILEILSITKKEI